MVLSNDFHENAEHKAKDFSIYAGDGHEGYDSGYQCTISKELSSAEQAGMERAFARARMEI